MIALIRTIDGRETPAPGRWSIISGQSVTGRAGRWPRRRAVNAHTTSGALLITDAGNLAFQLRLATAAGHGLPATTLTYQSICTYPGPGDGLWSIAGELIVEGRLTPARSRLVYHGVFRSGPSAIAWLRWQLSVPILRLPGAGPGVTRHLTLSADLSADAPPDLTFRFNHNHSPRRASQP